MKQTGHVPRRVGALERLRGRQSVLQVLVALTMASTLAMTGVGYLSARSTAIDAAQKRAAQDVGMVREVLGEQGPTLAMRDNQLVAGNISAPGAGFILNNDSTVVDHAQQLTGDDVTIYQLEGPDLTAISSNLPRVNAQGQTLTHARALGDHLIGPAYQALVGNCGAISSKACHTSFAGVTTLQQSEYVAAFTPLFDANDNFIGALGVARPIADVTSGALQVAIVLVLIGLLAALGVLVGGTWLLSNTYEHQSLSALDARLDDIAATAADLERLARTAGARAQRQERLARVVNDHARELDQLAAAIEQERTALGNATSDIWAEISQPGAPNPATALRNARQAAVLSARIGAATAEVRERCRQIVGMMNQVIAEGQIFGADGRRAEQRANDLRAAITGAEMALGTRLVDRQHHLTGASPVVRPHGEPRASDAQASGNVSAGPRRSPQAGPLPPRSTGQYPTLGTPSRSGHYPAVRPSASGQHPSVGGTTGQYPAFGRTGEHPIPGVTGKHQIPGGSPYPPRQPRPDQLDGLPDLHDPRQGSDEVNRNRGASGRHPTPPPPRAPGEQRGGTSGNDWMLGE